MVAPSLDSLRTPANGQILALEKPLSNASVRKVFKTAAAKASGRAVVNEIRQKRTSSNGDSWASLLCFPVSDPPSFFHDSALEERIFSFLLLMEVEVDGKWFLGLFRSGAAKIGDWLESKAKHLSRTKLTNAFSDGTAVSRLSVQRMTVSKHELRGASYEAADLQTSLPMMAASRCAIRSLRFIDDVHGSLSVTTSTSRVQRSGGRCKVEDLAEFVRRVARETLTAKPNPFLGTFAQSIPMDELPAGTEPNSILFDWSALLEQDGLELLRAGEDPADPGVQMNKRLLTRVFGEALSVTADGEHWNFWKAPGKPLGTFAATTTKYSVRTILENRLVIHDLATGDLIPLTRWTRENDAYSVTFNQPEYFFGKGGLYHRADFASEVNAVKRCLESQGSLAKAKSEKGKPKRKDTRFPPRSIFGIVEDSIYAKRTWLCCTDLGDEWADFLCIRDNTLLFIHCKGAKQTTGASSFQEVVGQGLKNLGRVRSTPREFDSKLATTGKKADWGKTKIRKLREPGRNWADFQKDTAALLANPYANREVHLVVTMLSQAEFEAAAAAPPEPHFIQLVWLLASFINSCREMGAKPVIVCKP